MSNVPPLLPNIALWTPGPCAYSNLVLVWFLYQQYLGSPVGFMSRHSTRRQSVWNGSHPSGMSATGLSVATTYTSSRSMIVANLRATTTVMTRWIQNSYRPSSVGWSQIPHTSLLLRHIPGRVMVQEVSQPREQEQKEQVSIMAGDLLVELSVFFLASGTDTVYYSAKWYTDPETNETILYGYL